MPDRLAGWVAGRWGSFILFAALGGVMALGQAPVGWPWLAWLALVLAFGLFTLVNRARAAAWRGWALGVGYFAGTTFWIVEPFFVDPWRHGWMAPFALAGMAGGFAILWSAAFGMAAGLGRGPSRRALWGAMLLVAAELLRAHLWTGFPWALLGHIWIGQPQMHLAALGGPHLLTLFTCVSAALPAVLGARRAALGGIAAVILLALPVPYGLWRAGLPVEGGGPVVRLVQPNAPQHEKWDPERIPVFFERLLEETSAPAEQVGEPALVAWPETSLAYLLEPGNGTAQIVAAAAGGVPIVVGLQQWDGRAARNSLVVIAPDASVTASYDKSHLVPFGEYIPGGHLLGRFAPQGLAEAAMQGFEPGGGLRLIAPGAGLGRFLPLICYEAIFAEEINAAPRADWVLHITNDAWFGTVSGPYQHLAQARLRAVEQGVPVLRAANTGVSAVIDAQGRMVASLPMGASGHIDAPLPPRLSTPPPYRHWGDWPVFAVLVLAALMLLALPGRAIPVDPRGASD
ncbi:apolipoprotein N-acyltransferase [Vannielia sp.]|uniref:apolipoprotein N-acyltransferase n=1 Tax=Vannielia sp. TaxID=2813045 RepID=UPI00261A4F9B|nr:apolipoprotein N-acyltransferase [Vannielia sp.]